MDLLPSLYISSFMLGWAGFVARVLAIGMTCAVMIWFKSRTGG